MGCAATWDPDGAGPLPEVLVVGGLFDSAGNEWASNVATWDGAVWHALGTGLRGPIKSLVVYHGEVYVAGNLSLPRDSNGLVVARWDGAAWQALGDFRSIGNATGSASALVVFGDSLYVGGSFNSVDGAAIQNLARWDGSSWSSVGDPLSRPAPALASVTGLAIFQNEVVATGSFTAAGATTVSSIASWNGQRWADLQGGLDGTPRSIVDWNGRLVVSGPFTHAGGIAANNIAAWNGTSWAPFGAGFSSAALTVWNGDLIAASFGTPAPVSRWSGTDWLAIGAGTSATPGLSPSALAVFRGALFVGGGPTSGLALRSRYGIARWDGTAWQSVGTGTQASGADASLYPAIGAMVRSGSDLIVGGTFSVIEGTPANNLARWDGTAWHAMGEGVGSDSSPFAVPHVSSIAIFNNEVVVAGSFTRAGSAPTVGIATWNGVEWRDMSAGRAASAATSLAIYQGALYCDFVQTATESIVMRWDGSSWQRMGPPAATPFPSVGLVEFQSELYVIGWISGSLFVSLKHWNGTQWNDSTFVNGPGGFPKSFTVAGGLLHILTDGGYLMSWNGTQVSTPQRVTVSPRVLSTYHGALYVGAGTSGTTSNLLRWDGAAAAAVSAAPTNPINSLLEYDGTLYVGGFFLGSQDHVSSYLARYVEPIPPRVLDISARVECPSGRAVLSVAADGDAPEHRLRYRWRAVTGAGSVDLVDGARAGRGTIAGAASAVMSIVSPSGGDEGEYDVVIENDCGGITSNRVTLRVCVADIDDGTPAHGCDGGVEISDLLEYLSRYQSSSIAADLDDGSGRGMRDGGVTIDDLLYYLILFAAGDVSGDIDDGSGTGTHDGGVTIDDLLYFLARFAAGC